MQIRLKRGIQKLAGNIPREIREIRQRRHGVAQPQLVGAVARHAQRHIGTGIRGVGQQQLPLIRHDGKLHREGVAIRIDALVAGIRQHLHGFHIGNRAVNPYAQRLPIARRRRAVVGLPRRQRVEKPLDAVNQIAPEAAIGGRKLRPLFHQINPIERQALVFPFINQLDKQVGDRAGADADFLDAGRHFLRLFENLLDHIVRQPQIQAVGRYLAILLLKRVVQRPQTGLNVPHMADDARYVRLNVPRAVLIGAAARHLLQTQANIRQLLHQRLHIVHQRGRL